jgi:hypothetical protein
MYDTPCYVARSDGWRTHVSYQDDWCYGPSQHVATLSVDDWRATVRADVRRHPERNRIPLYWVSDHGNVNRVRRITLRNLRPTR